MAHGCVVVVSVVVLMMFSLMMYSMLSCDSMMLCTYGGAFTAVM